MTVHLPRNAVLVAAVCGLAVTSCAGSNPILGDGAPPFETVRRPFTADELDIALDEDGRPYDAGYAQYWAGGVEHEELTRLVVPDGKLRVMDGSAIQVDPAFFADGAAVVDFDTDELVSSVVWEVFDETDTQSVLALIVSVPESSVDRWGPFEYAYGTDGGVGGVTSQSVIDLAANSALGDDYFIAELGLDNDTQVSVHDVDGVVGDETIIFANGYGDGAFPMSRGLDAAGRLVSVAIVDTRHPWRLAIPEGTPPADITAREDEIAECLAGERDVELIGDGYWCASDM